VENTLGKGVFILVKKPYFVNISGLRQRLKESHYGLVECPSTFKINEMASIGEALQLSSSNALRQQPAVLCRYQLVTVGCENKSRGLNTAEAVTDIEAADRLQLSLQSIIRLQGSV
jgi:urease beta subunit